MHKVDRRNDKLKTATFIFLSGLFFFWNGFLVAQNDEEDQYEPAEEPIQIAQVETGDAVPPLKTPAPTDSDIEEVITIGRNRSVARDVIEERIKRDVPVDFLSSTFISRVGDSDVGAALKRLPGLTLVDNKYVYVRGLGERYSSAQLNGATIPSPDLSRNVLPLDIFPTDLVDSLAVHKGFAPDLPAAFGGGSIDIRTKKVPNSRTIRVNFKTGENATGSRGLTYPGGSSDRWGTDDDTRSLNLQIDQAIQTYRGNFAPLNIYRTVVNGILPASIDDARLINRRLATFLNRNIDLIPKDLPYDLSGDFAVGDKFYVSDEVDVGVMLIGSYSNDWRLKQRVNRRYSNPETDYSDTERTVNKVDLTVSLNVGLQGFDDHEIASMALFLRNTEDDASSTRTCVQGQFNDCLDTGSPVQGRIFSTRFEQRELELFQADGTHVLGDNTLEFLTDYFPVLYFLDRLNGSRVTWYYSDATASTSIPNEVRISGQERLDSPNGTPIEYRIRSTGSAVDFRFSELEDISESYGYDISIPIISNGFEVNLHGGWDYTRKVRNYKQTSFAIGSTDSDFYSISAGRPQDVFSDANIMNPDYNINLLLGVGEFGSESYIAVHVIDAGYIKLDYLLGNDWRFSGGFRKEIFTQFSLPVDYLEFESSRVGFNSERDVQAFADTILRSEELYPSIAITRSIPDLWNTDQVQFRFVSSKTVARPDIRETSASTYIDPITEARVRGNPLLDVSDLLNFDFRVELFYPSRDNLTASIFYKDIDQPIETVQGGATEDNIRFNFVNAQSAFVYGVELEWLKSLTFLAKTIGPWIQQFYVSGNSTLSTSEIDIPTGAGVGNLTNQTRRMTQQSNWVLNLQLGFDSEDAKHGATLVYNAFGERIYFAGIDGLPDGFEQPFHAFDLVYTWFPTESMTFKARIKNILDASVQVDQGDVTVIEQTVGTSILIDFSYNL